MWYNITLVFAVGPISLTWISMKINDKKSLLKNKLAGKTCKILVNFTFGGLLAYRIKWIKTKRDLMDKFWIMRDSHLWFKTN